MNNSYYESITNYKFTEMLYQWRETRAAIAGKIEVLKLINQSMVPVSLVSPFYSHPNRDVTVDDRTNKYWQRAKYFNATGRTKESLSGMIWSKNPEVVKPTQLNYLDESESGPYMTIREIAQKTTDELLQTGRYGILVDMPSTEDASMLDNATGAASPYMVGYKAEQITDFVEDGGLQYVELQECYWMMNGDEWEQKEQTRKLKMIDGVYHNQVWRGEDLYSDAMPTMGGMPMSFIPFQFFGADDNSPEYSKVPLFDLASINLGHFTLDADNRDNLHYHGQGMTNIYTDMDNQEFAELNPGGIDVGAKGKNIFKPNDKVEILQIAATGAIAAEMERDEARMVMAGAQLVTDTNSNQTLGAKRIDSNANTSVLKRIVENASMGLTQCLRWCADFIGQPNAEIKYQLNSQFVTDDMDPQMVAQHIAMVQAGYLPQQTLFETSRKAGLTRKDDETLIQEIADQASGIQGTSEEVAVLMAENEALREQLEQLQNQGE